LEDFFYRLLVLILGSPFLNTTCNGANYPKYWIKPLANGKITMIYWKLWDEFQELWKIISLFSRTKQPADNIIVIT
jgi:hypothetical protein